MILLDSNVPMYLVGADHPNKATARRLVEASLDSGERLVTDVEVLQEILHRYVAIHRRDAIDPAFALLTGLVDDIFPIDLEHVGRARDLVLTAPRLSARDALHVAVMQREGVATIMSFDRAFDAVPGMRRLG